MKDILISELKRTWNHILEIQKKNQKLIEEMLPKMTTKEIKELVDEADMELYFLEEEKPGFVKTEKGE